MTESLVVFFDRLTESYLEFLRHKSKGNLLCNYLNV